MNTATKNVFILILVFALVASIGNILNRRKYEGLPISKMAIGKVIYEIKFEAEARTKIEGSYSYADVATPSNLRMYNVEAVGNFSKILELPADTIVLGRSSNSIVKILKNGVECSPTLLNGEKNVLVQCVGNQ